MINFCLYRWNENFVVDSSTTLYYRWIGILSVTVLFNMLLLPVRAAFEIPQRRHRTLWFFFDYIIDVMNIIDLFIGSRTGKI